MVAWSRNVPQPARTRADTSGMDQEQVDIERATRRKIAVVASICGVLFLLLSIGSGDFAPTPAPTTPTYRLLWIASALATIIAVAISYLRRNVLTVAVVQTGLAFITLMLALLFSFDAGATSIGPSGAASIVGSALVAYSASARVRWTPPFSCA
jgi:hypothetical protein